MKHQHFRGWLNKQTDRDDPIGDLAVDTKGCSDNPSFETYAEWHAYLTKRGACREAYAALSDAWREYQEYLKS